MAKGAPPLWPHPVDYRKGWGTSAHHRSMGDSLTEKLHQFCLPQTWAYGIRTPTSDEPVDPRTFPPKTLAERRTPFQGEQGPRFRNGDDSRDPRSYRRASGQRGHGHIGSTCRGTACARSPIAPANAP